jgi:sulfotransferase family protein
MTLQTPAHPAARTGTAPAASLGAPFRHAKRLTWQRYVYLPLFWGLIVPYSKLFPRRFPRGVSRGMARAFARFPAYEPTAHDVLVCSYFKSGTNWTMQIAVQVAHRGRAEFEHIHDLVPWPEMPARGRFAVPLADERPRAACPTGLRVIKTHLAVGSVPYSSAAR